jgi:hypothetical protein
MAPKVNAGAPSGCQSLRQYAMHMGVGPSSVVKAIEAGRLRDGVIVDARGRRWIHTVLADQEWAANTSQGPRSAAYVPPAEDQPSLMESRRAREAHKAELLRLELEEKRGRLVPVEDVAETVAVEYARLRQRLLAIPGKAGQEVIGAETAADAARMIEAYIVEALTELSEGAAYGR